MTLLSLLFKNTDGAKWGAGKGSPLTSLEADNNMWSILQAINAMIASPPSPVQISNILVTGSQMQFEMSDGSHFGPFTLPVVSMTYRQEGFVTGATYKEFDFIPVPQYGLYLVRHGFTATADHATFDPADVDGTGDPLYQLVFGEETYIYDFSFGYPGKPGAGVAVGDDIAEHMFLRDVYFPANFTNSLAKLSVAPTANLVYEIMKDGVTFGSLTFATGSLVGAFASTDPVQFSNGETLGLKKLTDTDATAKGLRIGFSGVRGLIPV